MVAVMIIIRLTILGTRHWHLINKHDDATSTSNAYLLLDHSQYSKLCAELNLLDKSPLLLNPMFASEDGCLNYSRPSMTDCFRHFQTDKTTK